MDMTNKRITLHLQKGKNARCIIHPHRIKIIDEHKNVVFEQRLFLKNALSLDLPVGSYCVEVSSLGGIWGKRIESCITIDETESSNMTVIIDIVNRNYLASFVPFLGYFTTLFYYQLKIDNPNAIEEKGGHTASINKGVSILFNALAVFIFTLMMMTFLQAFGVGIDQELENAEFVNANLYLAGTDAYTKASYEYIGMLLSSIALYAIFLILGLLCLRLSRFFKRRIRRKTLDFQNPTIPDKYAIYLRSFNYDKLTDKELSAVLCPGQTEESLLVDRINQIAPVYAIGCPGDKYLPVGAERIYVSDDEWKNKVETLAKDASVVMLRLGETNGFWWEVDHCFQNIDRQKLLFIIPATQKVDIIAMLYGKMMSNGIIDKPLNMNISRKSKTGIAGFLYFDSDGHPVFKKLHMNWLQSWFVTLDDVVAQTLADFLTRFQIKIRKKNLWGRTISGLFLYLLFVGLFTCGKYVNYLNFDNNRFPKEFIEACSEYPIVSEQISDYNSDRMKAYILSQSANVGAMLLNDEETLELFGMTWTLMEAISPREAELVYDNTFEEAAQLDIDMIILSKRYFTEEAYYRYIELTKRACVLYWENIETANSAYLWDEEVLNEFLSISVDFAPSWYASETPTQVEKQEFLLGLFEAAAQMYNLDNTRIDVIKHMLVLPLD